MPRSQASGAAALLQGLLFGLFEGDIDGAPFKKGYRYGCRCGCRYRCRYFDCLKGVSQSVQVLLNGIEAVMVLTLIILK